MQFDLFEHDNKIIRTMGTAENPLFCLSDICDILNIANASQKASKLNDDERQIVDTKRANGKIYPMTFVNEMGLYNVALSCRGASEPGTAAFKFKRWVTSDVIPKVRKTGEYSLKRKPDDELASLKLKASMMCAEEAKAIHAKAVGVNDARMADWAETFRNSALSTTLSLCNGAQPLAIEAPKASRSITELMADIGGEYATYDRTTIGKAVSKAFREKYGKAPRTRRKRLASGHEANVNVYDEADWGWIKAHIVL